LLVASEILFPDPDRGTAGIHFMSMLSRLGVVEALQTRLRPHPNGTTAMLELDERAPFA